MGDHSIYKNKADRLGVPLIEPLPQPGAGGDPNPITAICGECGMELRKVMWIACQNARCPLNKAVLR